MPIHTSFFLLSLSLFLTITKPIKQIVSPEKWKLVLHVGLFEPCVLLTSYLVKCVQLGESPIFYYVLKKQV